MINKSTWAIFQVIRRKEANGARCKFSLIKKKYVSTCVRFFYFTVSVLNAKMIVKQIFLVLNFSEKKKRMNPMGFESESLV